MPESQRKRTKIALIVLGCLTASWFEVSAGVSREIQNTYIQAYENRAMYLKIPIHGVRQSIYVRASGPILDSSNLGQPALFRVGDQVRITNVDFRNEFVRFKLSAIDGSRPAELHFLFTNELTSLFPQKPYFDEALNYSLTLGQSYKDIEAARENFVEDQFDRLLNQFAGTAGISRDELIDRITRESSDFQRTRSELSARTEQLEGSKTQLAREQEQVERLSTQNAELQRSIRQAEAAADSLKEERLDLMDERDALKKQLADLESAQAEWQRKNMQYEQQVDDLIRNLDLQADSSGELDNKVASLSTVIGELKNEGTALSEKLAESGRRATELTEQNAELEEQLRKLRNEKARLDSNLRVLTTGKNSINKTLLEVQEERDNLLAAEKLEGALKWQLESGEGDRQQATISLGPHKLAEFELQQPATTGEVYLFQFQLESPDLVKFNEEERALYDLLGEQVQVETRWRTPEGIEARLEQGEAVRSLEPRGEATWNWSFAGDLQQPQAVIFDLCFKDVNGNEVQIAEREFVLESAGLFSVVSRSFSFWSLLVGLGVGLAAALFLRRPKPTQRPAHPADYMARKRL